jgi:hypothetical protein
MTSSRSSCSCRRAPGVPGLPEQRGCRLGSANAGSGTALELSPGLKLGGLLWPALSRARGSAVAAGPAAAGLCCNACMSAAALCSQPCAVVLHVEIIFAKVWITHMLSAAAASAWAARLPQRHACSAQSRPVTHTGYSQQRWLGGQAPGGTDGCWQRPPRGREHAASVAAAGTFGLCSGGGGRPHPLSTKSLGAPPQAYAVTQDRGGSAR